MSVGVLDVSNIRRKLDPDDLLESAATEAGLDDYGEESFREAFTRWHLAVVEEGRLHPAGADGLRANTLRLLVNRLRIQRDITDHPDILHQHLAPPIIIVGMPRTGTTKLQRIMSRDPGTQPLLMWRLLNPAPVPGWRHGAPDERVAMAKASIAALREHHPEAVAGHPVIAEEPDEETYVLEMAFESLLNAYRARVPSYESWWHGHPQDGAYRYLRQLLQYFQWQDQAGPQRSFVLKGPGHLGHLDTLATVFPGATIVHCHRDPRVAVPSLARLVEVFRRMSSDDVDLPEIGSAVLTEWATAWSANLAQRAAVKSKVQILDVQYRDILKDPTGIVSEVYAAHGLTISDEVRDAIAGWEHIQPQHSLGRHVYSPEPFELTTHRVDEAFTDYGDHFGTPADRT